jgi:ubiquinone/menaquinone biosynthesis C-methylase UbiE
MTDTFLRNKQWFFDRWAPNYDCLLTTVFYQAVHKRLLDYAELGDQANILDLGCGTGRLLDRIAKQFPTVTATGVDLSNEMIYQARSRNLYPQQQMWSLSPLQNISLMRYSARLVSYIILILNKFLQKLTGFYVRVGVFI